MLKQIILPVLLLLFCNAPLMAQERITSFDSYINVDQSGLLTVVETISVIARGDQIKRGIYRDFPTDYSTPSGIRVKVDFKILDIQRDGQREPYHTQRMTNGIRVYIGDKDVFLDPGPYTYSITYQTDRQIGFFAGYDELYWNVTGNDWVFPIDVATATIVLPEGSSFLQHSIYTGSQGSTAANAEVTAQSGQEIRFRTTRPLAPGEGLTIAVAWPKGIISKPDITDKASFFLRDNLTVLVTSAGLLILVLYYLVVWTKVGRDPEPGTIIPLFEAPKDFTPAAARFVMEMGFDNKTFTSAVVNMAVKKYLVIDNDQSTFTLEQAKNADQKTLSRGEKKIAGKLFSDSQFLILKQSNHRKISAAITALRMSLHSDFETMHFKRNSLYILPGALITLLVILSMVITAHQKEVAGFMALWLSGWSAGCYFLVLRTFTLWKIAVSEGSNVLHKGSAFFMTLFSIPFVGGWIGGFIALAAASSFLSGLALIMVLGLNFLFYYLLKAPTLLGRRIMDQLEGLKLYLSVAEKDRLNLLNPPEKTPELFEKFLPWALALDVEQQWTEQFNELLEQARQDGTYSPTWYNNHHIFSTRGLATSLGSSLSASISSSARAPGSSSGSGGGGSSGGGGGGGGGGGW